MKLRLFFMLLLCTALTSLFSQEYPMGMDWDPAITKTAPQKILLASVSYRGMPASYSLEKYAPSIGNQGQYGTCNAFACGYAAATMIFAQTHGITDKKNIDKCAFSPTFLYQNIVKDGGNNCQAGSHPVTALIFMNEKGLPFNKTVPYACGKSWSSSAEKEAAKYKIADAALLFGKDSEVLDVDFKVESTKKALLENTPVIIGFELPKSFFKVKTETWNPDPAEALGNWQHGKHAMTVVAYDDYKAGGAFKLMNSWGSDWGSGGYVWVKYADYTRCCLMAFQAFGDANSPLPDFIEEAPQPTPRPKVLPKRDEVVDVDPKPTPKPQPKVEPKPNLKPEPKKDVVIKPDPKPQPKPTPQYDPTFTLKGSVEFKQNTGETMSANRVSIRNLVVEDEIQSNDKNKKNTPGGGNEDLVAYRMDKSYPSGTKFRFFININEQAYVYAFATDLTGQVNRIMPLPNRKGIGEMTADGLFNIIELPSLNENNFTLVGAAFFKCQSMVATKDGRFVYASGRDWDVTTKTDFGVIVKIDLNTKKVTQLYKQELKGDNAKVSASFNNLKLSPDNKYLFASFLCGKSVAIDDSYLFDTQTSKVVKQWKSNTDTYYFLNNNQLLHTDLRQNQAGKPLIVAFELLQIPSLDIQKSFELPYYTASPIGNITYHFDVLTNLFSFISGNELVQLDMTTQKIVKKYKVVSPITDKRWSTISATDVMSQSSKMIISYGKDLAVANVDIIDLKTFEKAKQLGENVAFRAVTIRSHPAKNTFSITDNGSQIRFLEFIQGDIKIKNPDFGSQTSVNWSPDGKKAAFFDGINKTLGVFDADNLSAPPRTVAWNENTDSKNLIWSADSKSFAIGTGIQISIFNAANLTITHRLTGNEKFASKSDEHHINFSKNGKYLIAFILRPDPKSPSSPVTFIVCYDIINGQKVWETRLGNSAYFQLTFINNDKTIVFLQEHTGNFIYMDAATGQEVGKLVANTYNGNTRSGTISSDGTKGVYAIGNNIFVYDLVSKTKISDISHMYFHPKNFCFLKNNNFISGLYEDNSIHIFNIAQKKEVARLVTFQNGKDWVVTTRDGRFDATQGALENMYYVKNSEIIPLNALFEKFYTPKLLSRILEEDKFEPTPVDINTLKIAPTIKISIDNQQRNLIVEDDIPSYNSEKEQVVIKIQADCPSDAVTEIRLFQNGKLVQTTRNLVVVDENTEGVKSLTKTFTILLNEGTNNFKALAFNSQRTESTPAEMAVVFKAPKSSNSQNTEGGIQLHLVVIGINKYKNPKYNLNYATADATSFKEAIEKGSTTIFSKTNVVFVGDDKATKEGIVSALDKVKTTATAKDVFIFYYAGHGVLNDKKDFFLVPHDVTQLYGADGALSQKGLSANELQQYSKDIKAQKQLFILDACQSAGALEQVVAARGAAEEKAIAQLARSTGTYWLTASGSTQFASEFTQLGHGSFTYILLEALRGKADTGDKKITVKEVDTYLQEQVPILTAKYKGTPQYPASYGYGNDFPVGIVKE